MAQSMFFVKLINKGRTLEVMIPAHSQKEARELAEHQYPSYKTMTAQRVS